MTGAGAIVALQASQQATERAAACAELCGCPATTSGDGAAWVLSIMSAVFTVLAGWFVLMLIEDFGWTRVLLVSAAMAATTIAIRACLP
jgi:hypothetical protein